MDLQAGRLVEMEKGGGGGGGGGGFEKTIRVELTEKIL